MKKVFVSICIASTVLAMFSCRSVEKAIPLSSINGEWNIIEVNGSKIAPGESQISLQNFRNVVVTTELSGGEQQRTKVPICMTRPDS